jgi:hypothetical protein
MTLSFQNRKLFIVGQALLHWAIHRPRQEHLSEERDLEERKVALTMHGEFGQARNKQITLYYDRITNEFGTEPDTVVPPFVQHTIEYPTKNPSNVTEKSEAEVINDGQ